MKQLHRLAALSVVTLALSLSACSKDKPKGAAPTASAAAAAEPALKQDDDLASKLALAYPKIRCALAANRDAVPTLYKDAGFADSTTYFKAFDVQAKANPDWARKVIADALAKPCYDVPAPAPPPATPTESQPVETPPTGNTP